MSSTLASSHELPGKMDRTNPPHESNHDTPRQLLGGSSISEYIRAWTCSIRPCNFTTSNDDASRSWNADAVRSEKNVTPQEIESRGATPSNVSSHSAYSDNQHSPCQQSDCSTYSCSTTNQQQDQKIRRNDVSNHWTKRSCFDRVLSNSWRTNHSMIEWGVYFFLFSICLFSMTVHCTNECSIGLKTAGRTWPPGDIIVEVGKPLNIYCILNQTYVNTHMPGKNASDLVFFRNKKQLAPQFFTALNETTALLTTQKITLSEDMYYCQIKLDSRNHEAVCLNKVVTALKPQKPKNFTCISYNWENLTCSWVPMPNNINTKFMLMFRLPGRAGGRRFYPCPKVSKISLPNTCMWDTSTNPIYRQPYETYTFVLNMQNILGNNSFVYKFNHYANVIPAKPENLTVVNKTVDSVLLRWVVPFPMQNFPPGLNYRIMYQNQWDSRFTWKIINITNQVHASRKFYNLTNLEYANTVYDVRVLMKSAVAKENRWSTFNHITFRTSPRLPSFSPRTDIGSFEITENNVNRDIYLYWQAIPEEHENGNNFTYQVISARENNRVIDVNKVFKSIEITRAYAKLKGASFSNYEFEIVSANEVGFNMKGSKMLIPSKQQISQEPLAFTKIAFEGGLYELSWKPPHDSENIVDYTIFWCDNERDRPYQCTGYLDWIHVSKNINIFNMTVPDPNRVYQFAISANTAKSSSGMIWASCTVIHNKIIGKMKSVWINRIGSDFIEVGWKLDCSDRIGVVEGFNIYYCPIRSPFNLNCKGTKLMKTIKADAQTIHGIVDNLLPYTTYMLAISILTKSGEGLHSDPLYNTTLEAAPSSPPLDVKIVNATNTTMFITWKTPKAMNGVLRFYEIYYNGRASKVEENSYVELNNLTPYTKYNISVVACTVACSKQSPMKVQYTDIGVPGKPNIPTVRFMNSSQVLVAWNVPEKPAGPKENMYYEIETTNGQIQNTTRLKIELRIPDCKTISREQQYRFRIRAVNIVENGEHLKGPWSDPGEGSCYTDGPSLKVWVLIWLLGSLSSVAVLLFVTYGSRRVWITCKAMQDVEVKLPPGLAPNMKLLQNVNDQHTRQSSAESSGCSSGQESVTCSLTAESQVSSDSGTEVDPVSASPAKLLEDALPSRKNKLRQRNIIQESSADTKTVHCWSACVKSKSDEQSDEVTSLAQSTPNLTDNTGYTTSPHTWSSTGYISMPSSEEVSTNPSPVPRENATVINVNDAGSYCVIGTKSESNKIDAVSNSNDDDINISSLMSVKCASFNDEANNTLKSIKQKTTAIVTNPYVTMASLEQKKEQLEKQKEKDNQQSATSKFQNGNLQLTSLVDDHSSKFNPNILSPCSIVSDTSKKQDPYVQTGLMNKSFASNPVANPEQSAKNGTPTCNLFTSTSVTDSCSKPYVSSFTMMSSSSLSPTVLDNNVITKANDASSHIIELSTQIVESQESLPQDKLYSSSTIPSSKKNLSKYVFTNPVYRMLRKQKQQKQQQQESASVMKNKNDDKNNALWLSSSWQTSDTESETRETATRLTPAKMPIITRQKSGYVTIENPDATSAGTDQSEEQYSKMMVVTNTLS